MTTLKTLLAIAAVACAAPVQAREAISTGSFTHGALWLVDASGHVTSTEAGPLAHDVMTKRAKILGTGMMLYMGKDRMYWMMDKKAADGKMLSTKFVQDFQLQGRF
jgi:hypothetical protein